MRDPLADMHPASFVPSATDPPPTRRTERWIAVVAASLLLHLAAFDLLPRWTVASTDDTPAQEPLRATLLPPIEPQAPVPTLSPMPSRAPVPRSVAPTRLPADFVPESLDPVPEVRAGLLGPSTGNAATPTESPPAVESATPAPASTPAAQPTQPQTQTPTPATAPQSARLSYQVIYTDRKYASPIRYEGVGTIDWAIAGDRYRSTLLATVPVLFARIDFLSAHSEGTVTASGVAPDRYTESPRKRPTVSTNFNRDARQSITFSASTASAPLVPGVQDRLSLLFQIGGLLLANGSQAVAGGHIDMPVAGVRGDVDVWSFESQGVEIIEVGPGPLSTTHLRRTPRPGSNDRIIDVWIAQADGGYPARVMYTEPDGSTVEMLLQKIGAID